MGGGPPKVGTYIAELEELGLMAITCQIVEAIVRLRHLSFIFGITSLSVVTGNHNFSWFMAVWDG